MLSNSVNESVYLYSKNNEVNIPIALKNLLEKVTLHDGLSRGLHEERFQKEIY